MRTRVKIEPFHYQVNVGGREGSKTSGGTCSRQLDLQADVLYWHDDRPWRLEEKTGETVVTMSDTLTPDYFRKLREGKVLPTNPMSISRVQRVTEPSESRCAYTRYRFKDCAGKNYQNIQSSQGSTKKPISVIAAPTRQFDDNDLNQLAVEAKGRLYSQGMDVLTTVVELRQTLAMLAGARKTLTRLIRDAVKHLRRKGKRPKSLRSLFQMVSDSWLEGRFGWRILYYDLLAIHQFIDNYAETTRLIVGRSSDRRVRHYAGTTNVSPSTVTDEVRVGFPGMLDLSQAGNYNILNTAWEVIPFSLVVDMFFDVQNRVLLLGGLPLNVKELPSSAFIVRKRRRESLVQADEPSPSANYDFLHIHNQPAVALQFYEIETRSLMTAKALTWPAFRLNLGGYKPVDLLFLTKILLGRL